MNIKTERRSHTVSQEKFATLRMAVRWLILNEKCCIDMGRNLTRDVVVTDGKEGNSDVQMKQHYLISEMNYLVGTVFYPCDIMQELTRLAARHNLLQ
jgi:hypothetical protein